MADKVKKIILNGAELEIDSGITGAKTTGGATLVEIADGLLKVGNLAALDSVSEKELNETLMDKIDSIRGMNGTQFSVVDDEYALTLVDGGSSKIS